MVDTDRQFMNLLHEQCLGIKCVIFVIIFGLRFHILIAFIFSILVNISRLSRIGN